MNGKEGENEKIQKLEERKSQISSILKHYPEKVEYLIQRDRFVPKSTIRKQPEDVVEAQLQELVLSKGQSMYEKMATSEEKVQVLDRIITIRNMLNNFDEDFTYIEKMQNLNKVQESFNV